MKVYISCPYSIPLSFLESAQKALSSNFKGHTFYYHDRHSTVYDNNTVKDCDVFAIIISNREWSTTIDNLSGGCKKEYTEALKLGKTILLVYKTLGGESYRLYNTTHDTNYLKGIPGYLHQEDLDKIAEKLVSKNWTIPTTKFTLNPADFTGDLKGFPVEVVQAMIHEQVRQGNPANIAVFCKNLMADKTKGGFSWYITKQGYLFWQRIFSHKDFDYFFEYYGIGRKTQEIVEEPNTEFKDCIDSISPAKVKSNTNLLLLVARRRRLSK